MGTSQLDIYNGALRWLEKRKLFSITENREPRRYLDDEYADNNKFCLAKGNWNHSMKSVQMGPSSTIIPNFGFYFAYPKPLDCNHVFMISGNEGFDPLLREWDDKNGIWYANAGYLFVRYVSEDPNYGMNLALWPPKFVNYVEARLAWCCAKRLKGKEDLVEDLEAYVKSAMRDAVNSDSQDLPPGRPPFGTWVLARTPIDDYQLDDGDLGLPGGAQNYQAPSTPPLNVIGTDTGQIIGADGLPILVE